jgi:hypothetical protein
MKRLTIPMLVVAGALCALQANADERQIDWNLVPGGHGRNDVSRDFVAIPTPLNTILSNDFSAWEPNQRIVAQARTTTGRAQRHAVLANPSETATASNVSYSETVVTTQAAPSSRQGNESLYSESGTQNQAQTQEQAQVVAPSGAMSQDMNAQKTQPSTEQGSEKMVKTDAKARLAPHTLIMESSLSSAMDQVRGLKGELGVTQDLKKTDQHAVQTYKTFIREMRNDVNVARTHERQLMNDVRRYPDLANSDEFKSVKPALRDLQTTLSSWESKANKSQYWNNQSQAKADIDKLERQLNNALDKVKSFSSSRLDTSIG